jgi:hypothetical protein
MVFLADPILPPLLTAGTGKIPLGFAIEAKEANDGKTENLVKRNFTAAGPNQLWASDITYVWTGEGWLYLAGHKDLFTGEVVGYAMAERMTKNLVIHYETEEGEMVSEEFDLVFLDPPYRLGLGEICLQDLGKGTLLAPRAMVVSEQAVDEQLAPAYGCLQLQDVRRYGSTAVGFYRREQK